MNFKHEVDPITLKTFFETMNIIKNIKITVSIDPASLDSLKEIVKGTIFWRG